MELSLTAPALLFPTVSLLLLAYTNRFLAMANLIRGLKTKYNLEHDPNHLQQINNLRRRVFLIRNMQAFGIASLFFAVMSMVMLFFNREYYGRLCFGLSLLLMLISLGISFRETLMQGIALDYELKDIERELEKSKQE
jgi:hypothetical protein